MLDGMENNDLMTKSSAQVRRPRVIIAEDDEVFRYTVGLIIKQECEVVGEAGDGAAAVELAAALLPDVVLLDISMPEMTGLEAARIIRERLPDARVIMVSNHRAQAYLEEALRIGVHGYVVKDVATSQLPTAIQDAIAGKEFRPS